MLAYNPIGKQADKRGAKNAKNSAKNSAKNAKIQRRKQLLKGQKMQIYFANTVQMSISVYIFNQNLKSERTFYEDKAD